VRFKASREQIILGAAILLAAGWFGWSLVTRYSPAGHSEQFRAPTLALLRAGLALDSAALARLDVSPAAARWVLDRSRSDPELLRVLEAHLEPSGVRHNRDHSEVTFDAKGLTRCGPWPLTVYFSGLPAAMRIEEVRSGCDPQSPP
jgi:hypothetical protein